jgi:threonine dehydratase
VRLENGVTDQTPADTGNHALALSWHGRSLGIPVTVFMPVVAPLTKLRAVLACTRRSKFWSPSFFCSPQVERCKKFGAKVVIVGNHIGEAKDFALSSPDYQGERQLQLCDG